MGKLVKKVTLHMGLRLRLRIQRPKKQSNYNNPHVFKSSPLYPKDWFFFPTIFFFLFSNPTCVFIKRPKRIQRGWEGLDFLSPKSGILYLLSSQIKKRSLQEQMEYSQVYIYFNSLPGCFVFNSPLKYLH